MRQTERQPKLMEVLYQRRGDTMENLAKEFGVSVRTIQRDLDELSLSHPIQMMRGRHGGGVRIMEGCRSDRQYLTASEQSTLENLCSTLKGRELADVQSILRRFSVPK